MYILELNGHEYTNLSKGGVLHMLRKCGNCTYKIFKGNLPITIEQLKNN